jgi:ATP-binding cassette subfamily F protein 3
MSLIQGEGVGKSYGAHQVFRGLSFRIEPGDRIGLVGPNGEGKTTLLRLLAGLDEPTYGEVLRRPGLRAGYLPQIAPASEADVALRAHLLAVFEPALAAERELRALSAELAALPPAGSFAKASEPSEAFKRRRAGAEHDRLMARLGALQTEFELRGGYGCERRVEVVLAGLGFRPEDGDRPLGQLSGGQRTRALLARLLLEAPELLLLDEPTNHLDLQALEWLEQYLAGFKGTLVLVAHDRYFLDRLSARVWELCFGALETYRGNYSAYLAQREERYAERRSRWQAQQEYVEKTLAFVRRYGAGQRSKEARGRLAHLERFLETEAVEQPREPRRIRVAIREAGRGSDLAFRTEGLVVGYDPARPLLCVPDLDLLLGQRVALLGANGAGKTTLLRTLLGEVPPLAGTVRAGAGNRVGYLAQTHAGLDPEAEVLEVVRAARPELAPAQVRSFLGSLLFCGDDVYKKVGELSGGQRSRVALARLALQGANLLVLDEPTNHLDLPSQEVLEAVLRDFAGTVLFVSHDRYLVDALATHLWMISGGELRAMAGGWSDYLRLRAGWAGGAGGAGAAGGPSADERRAKAARASAAEDARRAKRRRSRLAARHQDLERQIHELETELAALNVRIGSAGEAQNLDVVRRLGEQYQALDQRLKSLWDEWVLIGEELGA